MTLSLLDTSSSNAGPYQTGTRCPHHSCREMHQGSIFSSQWKYTFSPLSGRIAVRPSRTASSAGPTIFAVSTNHWSVSIGSMTTWLRSPKGCMIGFGSTSGTSIASGATPPSSKLSSGRPSHPPAWAEEAEALPSRGSLAGTMTARPSAVMSSTTRARASDRSRPR